MHFHTYLMNEIPICFFLANLNLEFSNIIPFEILKQQPFITLNN